MEKYGVYKYDGDIIKQCENWQMGDLFPAVDRYKIGILKDEQELVKLGGTNSPFFTTMEALEKSVVKDEEGNRKYDSRILNNSIQVAPWKDKKSKRHMYRDYVEIYKIKKPIEVTYGKTEANKQYGEGGAIQVVIPNFKELIKEGVIEKVAKTIELSNYDITREEYEKYKNLNEQQILKRNLMSSLCEKIKLLEINHDEKTKELIEKIDKKIILLKEDIEDITDKVGKEVNSPAYDKNIKYLEEIIENKGGKNLEIEEDIINKQNNLMNKVLNEKSYFPKYFRELAWENREINIEGLIDTYNSNQYRGKESIKDLYNISKEKAPTKIKKTYYEKLIDRKIKIMESISYIEMREKKLDIVEKSSRIKEVYEKRKGVLELKGGDSIIIRKYKEVVSKATNIFNNTSKELELSKEKNIDKLLNEERTTINNLKKDLYLKLREVHRDIGLYRGNKSLGSKLDNIKNQRNNETMNKLRQKEVKKIQTKGFDINR